MDGVVLIVDGDLDGGSSGIDHAQVGGGDGFGEDEEGFYRGWVNGGIYYVVVEGGRTLVCIVDLRAKRGQEMGDVLHEEGYLSMVTVGVLPLLVGKYVPQNIQKNPKGIGFSR